MTIDDSFAYDQTYTSIQECHDPALLTDYIENLNLLHLTGNYTFDNYDSKEFFQIIYHIPDGTIYIKLYEDLVKYVKKLGDSLL